MQSQQESSPSERNENDERKLLEKLGLSPGTWNALLVLPFFEVELLKQQEMHSRAINREPEPNWVRSSLRVNQRVLDRVDENLNKVFARLSSPTPGTTQGIRSMIEHVLALDETLAGEEALLKRGRSLLAWHLAEKIPENERNDIYRKWEEILKDNYRHQSPESFHVVLRDVTQMIEQHQQGAGISQIEEIAPIEETLSPEERLLQHWKVIAHRLGELQPDEREQALKELRVRLCEVDARPFPYEVELALDDIARLARQLTNLAMAEDSPTPPPAPPLEVPPSSLPVPLPSPPIQQEPVELPPESVPTLHLDLIQTGPLNHTSWEDLQSRIRHTPLAGMEKVLDSRLLFDEFRGECPDVAIVRDQFKVPENFWIVGDIHGDPVSLHYAWLYIREQSHNQGHEPHVVFLGDFIDRGPYSHEALLYLFDLLRLHPDRICVLPGNHDLALSWNEDERIFKHRVIPAEYAAYLNKILNQEEEPGDVRIGIARLAETFFNSRPRAVMLPDGLLLSHAGFPHTDLQESLAMPSDLSQDLSLQDFVWLRLDPRSDSHQPQRDMSGGEHGPLDFKSFCDVMTNRLGIPIQRHVRGHDHIPKRFQLCDVLPSHPILTLNTMGRRLEDEEGGDFPLACIGRYQPGKLPEVHQLSIDRSVIAEAFNQ